MKKSFIISMFITVIALVVALWFIITAKGEVPINWNLAGEPDRYGSPWYMITFPIVSLISTLLINFVPRLDPKGDNILKSGPILGIMMMLVAALMLGIQIFIIMATNGASIFNLMMFISITLGLLFLILGYYTPGIKPNYMMGIRTPWTLHSETVWTKTHQDASKWIMASGLLFLISIILPSPYDILVPSAFVVIVMLGTVIYSYLLFVKEKETK